LQPASDNAQFMRPVVVNRFPDPDLELLTVFVPFKQIFARIVSSVIIKYVPEHTCNIGFKIDKFLFRCGRKQVV